LFWGYKFSKLIVELFLITIKTSFILSINLPGLILAGYRIYTDIPPSLWHCALVLYILTGVHPYLPMALMRRGQFISGGLIFHWRFFYSKLQYWNNMSFIVIQTRTIFAVLLF